MIWFTWRQFRTQTWITAGGMIALAALLLITGQGITTAYTEAGLTTCGTDCSTALSGFLTTIMNGVEGTAYYVALGLMYVLPVVIGVFWGAPLLAREYESGTYRLAWSQSITRARWLGIKLGMIGAATAATTGLVSWGVTLWAERIDTAAADRITPLVYGARGIVPVGYAFFALLLGVTAGLLIRRSVPAMAVTLLGYLAAAGAMPLWIRARLLTPEHSQNALDFENLDFVGITQTGQMDIISNDPTDAWALTNQTVSPDGTVFTGPADPQSCGQDSLPGTCQEWLKTLDLRQDLVYHPGSHFWQLQWAETGILLAATALLTGFCFWWIGRRRA